MALSPSLSLFVSVVTLDMVSPARPRSSLPGLHAARARCGAEPACCRRLVPAPPPSSLSNSCKRAGHAACSSRARRMTRTREFSEDEAPTKPRSGVIVVSRLAREPAAVGVGSSCRRKRVVTAVRMGRIAPPPPPKRLLGQPEPVLGPRPLAPTVRSLPKAPEAPPPELTRSETELEVTLPFPLLRRRPSRLPPPPSRRWELFVVLTSLSLGLSLVLALLTSR
jgi:hypothetical protein